eukprot:11666598-Prorocentrum_lima.AAC.1
MLGNVPSAAVTYPKPGEWGDKGTCHAFWSVRAPAVCLPKLAIHCFIVRGSSTLAEIAWAA